MDDSSPFSATEIAIGILLAHGQGSWTAAPRGCATGCPHRFLNGGRKPATSGQVKHTMDTCVDDTYVDISEE